MAKSAGKVRIGYRRGAPCCVFFMRLENLPRPWTIVRGVGAAGSRSRPNHSGICSPTPTAQGTPITRAAGGVDPPAARRVRDFLGAPALPINLAGGGHEAPLPPIEASWRVHHLIPLGRASAGNRPARHLARGFALLAQTSARDHGADPTTVCRHATPVRSRGMNLPPHPHGKHRPRASPSPAMGNRWRSVTPSIAPMFPVGPPSATASLLSRRRRNSVLKPRSPRAHKPSCTPPDRVATSQHCQQLIQVRLLAQPLQELRQVPPPWHCLFGLNAHHFR